MIAVTDTSPLNYLIQIDHADVLAALFGKVLMPAAVRLELGDPRTPVQVRSWLSNRPNWLLPCRPLSHHSASLSFLGPGEREAIQLALESGRETVLIDETAGRKVAVHLGLEVTGTLGIPERGANLGLLNFRQAVYKLEQTKFRMSPAIKAGFLERNP